MRVTWFTWWVSWAVAAFWSDRSVKRPAAGSQILYRVLAGIGAILLFGLYRHPLESELRLWRTPNAVAWAMAPVVLAGLLFTWWARIHLGRLWSSNVARKADHHVVDTGMAVLTLGWYIKARMEEAFLREQLGAEQYGEYARRVPMLIPFLLR
jgi:protein-S-isoprenylcysteine O-methyltransferase Ste14